MEVTPTIPLVRDDLNNLLRDLGLIQRIVSIETDEKNLLEKRSEGTRLCMNKTILCGCNFGKFSLNFDLYLHHCVYFWIQKPRVVDLRQPNCCSPVLSMASNDFFN